MWTFLVALVIVLFVAGVGILIPLAMFPTTPRAEPVPEEDFILHTNRDKAQWLRKIADGSSADDNWHANRLTQEHPELAFWLLDLFTTTTSPWRTRYTLKIQRVSAVTPVQAAVIERAMDCYFAFEDAEFRAAYKDDASALAGFTYLGLSPMLAVKWMMRTGDARILFEYVNQQAAENEIADVLNNHPTMLREWIARRNDPVLFVAAMRAGLTNTELSGHMNRTSVLDSDAVRVLAALSV